ncbi:SusC/RagA family TonB-linked outer membrane protein [Niabella sp. CC-SYL272]|uniref:SusC/RagA family TonB-linked outer membrane protein n=1 Tax=Niabella agricola TaxID=2891571 RepID=UPI001F197612|nr:SusC/RagA family TonB-linked outer membrane protein [Niabella agricola]MCF3111764.1 SusC/RagA family TonB-linked outer membrane protein [Niabella agricola]
MSLNAYPVRAALFLSLLFISFQALAQQRLKPVTGVVTDDTGQPVTRASVIVKGTSGGQATDSLGRFAIDVPGNGVLLISAMGYHNQEVRISAQQEYAVVLAQKKDALTEVVVIGYGSARKKDLTGAVQTVNLEHSPLATLPNTNALQALSGTVSGLVVPPQSKAGQDPLASINIRGDHSIDPSGSGLNRPLIVVDDIIFNGSMNQINMQDVASINVLKDASSAAIYGSRSANGVIIITTKKGRSPKPVLTLNSSYAFQNWSRKPAMQMNIDQLLKNRWDYFVNAGRVPANTEFNASLILTPQELDAYNKGIKTNWLNEITQYAPVHNHNLGVSGNAQNVNYYLSAGILDQKGVIYNDHYKKATFLGKIETKINRYITFGAKANYYSADNSGLTPSMQLATWMSPLSANQTFTPGYEQWIPSNPSGSSARNPFVGFERQVGPAYGSDENKSQNIDGAGWLVIQAPWIKGLKYKLTVNGTQTHSVYNLDVGPRLFVDTRNTANMDNVENFWSMAYSTARTANTRTWLIDQILTYTNTFNKHSLDVMAGYTRDAMRYNALSTEGNGYRMPNPLKWNGINMAITQKINKTESRYQNLAMMVRANYNYDSKYYLTATFRRDGFSGFAPGNKYGNFPGISVGWALSEMDFFQKNTWIEYLKLRASWGATGNQSIAPYETLSTVGLDYTVFGDNSGLALYPNRMSNAKLSWSTTTTQNLGVDVTLLKGRISGNIDVYRSQTKDQLLTRSLPYMNGFLTVRTNVGRVDNQGIELVLNTVPVDASGTKGLGWESGIVFSRNRNKIVELYGTYDEQGRPKNDISGAPAGDAYIVGKSIHSVWDYKMIGIVQKDDLEYINRYKAKPGDVKFLDYNNDGKINTDDYHYQGTRDPLFILNFNNTFSYKKLSLYFSLKWVAGDDAHYLGKDRYGTMASMAIANGAQLKRVDPWTPDHPTNIYPRVDWVNSLNYWFWNTRSFMKLKDLTLSYTLDGRPDAKIRYQNLKLYASANNLFTLTKWTGLDPEDGGTIAANPGSIFYGSFPVLRTYSFGLIFSF